MISTIAFFICWKAFQIRFVIKLSSSWQRLIESERRAVNLRQLSFWSVNADTHTYRSYILKMFVKISVTKIEYFEARNILRHFLDNLWNELASSVSEVKLILVPLPLTCLFLLLPHLTLSTHHSHHPQRSHFHFRLTTQLPQIFPTIDSSSGLRTDFTDFMTLLFLPNFVF